MNKQYILLLLAIVCFALPSTAQEATFHKINESWTLSEDGSSTYRQYKELTLHTHTAMNRTYGETFITYNPKFQTLTINDSYTKQKDGTIVRTPENAFVDVLPKAAADAPAYNHLLEKVVVHTGLELGATIYLDYTLTSKAGYLPEIDICKTIRQSSPTKLHTFSISVPKGKELNAEVTVLKANPKVSTTDQGTTYVWTLRNVKPEPIEAFASIYTKETPFFVASTANHANAKQIITEQWNKKGDTQLLTLSETITKGIADRDKKIDAIRAFVVSNLGYSPLKMAENGFRFRPVNDIIQSAYGTEIEKINLLHGLLAAQGITSEVEAVNVPVSNEACLGLSSIQEWQVAVKKDGKMQRLTATGRAGINLETAETKTINKTIKLSPKAANAKGSYLILALPSDAASIARMGYQSLPSKRYNSLMLAAPVEETHRYEVALKGLSMTSPIGNKEIVNQVGSLTQSIEIKGSEAILVRKLSIAKRTISPKDYPAFRQLINAYTNPAAAQLLLKVEN